MLDLSGVSLEKMIIHFAGNRSKEEGYHLSKKIFTSFEEQTENSFLQYFIRPFINVAEFYHFFHPVDIALNEVQHFATNYFAGTDDFQTLSENIVRTLYGHSVHPNIMSGEVFVAALEGCRVDAETVQAIGIYKSEVKDTFLQVDREETGYDYHLHNGINIKDTDKGCIILNVKDAPLLVCAIDHTNKNKEAKYWMDDFLQLISRQDSFHFTKDYLDVAKKFVTEKMPEMYELSKTDKIDYLNRSINYFKSNDRFTEDDFLQDVFQHKEVINTFNQYKDQYTAINHVVLDDEFDISNQAVKKQARIFKSILKLDKNFHIYIHGNKNMIEKGVDEQGRKFYKIYYENEA